MSYIDKLTGLVRPGTAEAGGSSGGGEELDLSFVTATASDIVTGKVGANSSGKPVSGTLAESTPSLTDNVVTIPKGHIPEQKTLTVPESGDITVDDNVVAIPAGYAKSQRTATVAEAAAPTTSGNVVTIYKGYQSAQKKITVGTAKAAATITPGTSDQTIAAGVYLSGKQTIKGDADLKAANIKKGVQIFNVTGSYEGDGGTFGLAKVTEFSPATQAFSGLSEIVVSGLGGGYDTANGTYKVTAETEREADPFKRIYKHPSGEWYFWGEYNSEYEEGYFYIGPAENSGSFGCWISEEFSDGEYYFEDWDSGDSFEVTLDVTSTNYPATDMVLKGVIATGYRNGEWSFSEAETDFTGFEQTPTLGDVYAALGSELIGGAIDSTLPLLLMPLNGDTSATSRGLPISPTLVANIDFDSYGAVFAGSRIELPIDVKFFQGDATICFRVYQTGSSRCGYFAATADHLLGIDSNGGTYNIWAGNDGWNIIESDSGYGRSDVEVKLNQDVHLAYVHSRTGRYQLYVNGVLAKEITDSRVIGGGKNLRFGAWGTVSYGYNGKMRDVRVYSKALSAEQILKIANEG